MTFPGYPNRALILASFTGSFLFLAAAAGALALDQPYWLGAFLLICPLFLVRARFAIRDDRKTLAAIARLMNRPILLTERSTAFGAPFSFEKWPIGGHSSFQPRAGGLVTLIDYDSREGVGVATLRYQAPFSEIGAKGQTLLFHAWTIRRSRGGGNWSWKNNEDLWSLDILAEEEDYLERARLAAVAAVEGGAS